MVDRHSPREGHIEYLAYQAECIITNRVGCALIELGAPVPPYHNDIPNNSPPPRRNADDAHSCHPIRANNAPLKIPTLSSLKTQVPKTKNAQESQRYQYFNQ